MSTSSTNDIVIQVGTIGQLFNAPDVNPFSDKEIDVLGEAALMRAIRRLLGRKVRNWSGARLIIQLPADQITPGLQQKTVEAVRRYADAKIEDNKLTVRLSRTRGLIGLAMVTVITLIVLGITYLLLTGPLANIDQVLQGLIAASASVFAWVILWDPLEKLLFDWVGPRLENGILRKIRAMEIVIEPLAG